MGVFEQFPYSNFHDLNLDWILKAMKEAVSSVDAFTGKVTELDNKVDDMQQEIAIVNSMIQQINSEIAKIENGQYVTLYLNCIKNWIDDNIQRLVADIVKYVAFGLDDKGYFYADIPATWQFLKFDTNVDPASPDYGHLLMSW
jgi:hypothetical protein